MSLRNFVRIAPVLAVAAGLTLLPVASALATETGGSIDPNGAEISTGTDGVTGDTGGSIDPNG